MVIFDAFYVRNSDTLNELLEDNKVLVVKVPSGCTNELHLLDLSVNKPCKSFLREKFSTSYSLKVAKQLQAKEVTQMQVVKELSAQ